MLKGKRILLGITGSISVYKVAHLASLLKQAGADTHVIMTENAKHFMDPIVFDTLTGNRVLTDVFDRTNFSPVAHIALGQGSDVFLIAPCSADVIGKLANGIADDLLTSTAIAADCPVLIAPAMNTRMLENPAVQDNLKKLAERGVGIIDPAHGYLACGVVGSGKLPEGEVLMECLDNAVGAKKDLKGRKVVVSAGATREALDPVRFITNHSSGKMGVEIARAAAARGAEVTLVAAHMDVAPPLFAKVVKVVSAEDMFRAVTEEGAEADIIVMAAAVADYRPAEVADHKIKKKDGDLSIALERTKDILKYLGEHKREGQFLCGFAMETEDLEKNASGKLKKKNADLIVGNNLNVKGAGFGTETNVVTFVTPDGCSELPIMSKREVGDRIFDLVLARTERN